jgi:cytochrome b561
MLKSDARQWGSVAKFFHWTIVLLILAQGALGLVMVELPKRPDVIPVYDFHKSLGLTVLALALLRLAWRALDPRPADPPGMPRWQARAARAGHAVLYALLFAVPLSGWWFDSVAALRPLYWFGLIEIPHLGGANPALKEFAAETHETLFWVLVAVAAGHAAVALVHHFHQRDEVLRRMWPAALQRRGAAKV